jgi:hypothetical protein
MILTSYAGQPVFLITEQPDWATPPEATFTFQGKCTAGLTDREERESMSSLWWGKLTFTATLSDSEVTALKSALDQWDNTPILCPFWPAMTKLAGPPASIVGPLVIWFEPDFSTWGIGPSTGAPSFTPSAACLIAPILWGRFDTFPTVTHGGVDARSVPFALIENGPPEYALAPAPATLATAVVNGLTVPVMTVPFAWGKNTAVTDVRLKREKIGFSRGDADTYYPHAPRTHHKLSFEVLTTAETAYLLALFADRNGAAKAWQCPSSYDETLELVRFYGDALTLTWSLPAIGGECVDAEVETVTLPSEIVALSGETPGATIGGTPPRWFGYVITDGANTWWLTSHDVSLAGPGGTFTPANISHETISEEINLQKHDCQLSFQNWAGSPFGLLRSHPNSPPLTVSIYEGLVSDPADAELIYTGIAQAPNTAGPIWKVQLLGPASNILTVKGPRMVLQQTCLACFGDSKCGFDVTTVSVAPTLVGYTGGVAEFSFGSPETLPDKRFADGTALRVIGGKTQAYAIVDSYELGDNNLGIVIAGAINPAPTGSESGWTLVPGCDGQRTTCKAFGNYSNFRGFPFVPNTNPAMVQNTAAGSGKKGSSST